MKKKFSNKNEIIKYNFYVIVILILVISLMQILIHLHSGEVNLKSSYIFIQLFSFEATKQRYPKSLGNIWFQNVVKIIFVFYLFF